MKTKTLTYLQESCNRDTTIHQLCLHRWVCQQLVDLEGRHRLPLLCKAAQLHEGQQGGQSGAEGGPSKPCQPQGL